MVSIDSVLEAADKTFSLPELTLPIPGAQWKERIHALEDANLPQQRTMAIFEMRCWQAQALGLLSLSPDEIVELIMGEPHTKAYTASTEMEFEYCYNHRTDSVEKRTINTWMFERIAKDSPWYMPPFFPKLKWRCVGGALDYLKLPIPAGIIFRIQELKKLRLFNCFMVFAPEDAWKSFGKIDPIVVARISEFATDEDGDTLLKNGRQALYVIGKWQ